MDLESYWSYRVSSAPPHRVRNSYFLKDQGRLLYGRIQWILDLIDLIKLVLHHHRAQTIS